MHNKKLCIVLAVLLITIFTFVGCSAPAKNTGSVTSSTKADTVKAETTAKEQNTTDGSKASETKQADTIKEEKPPEIPPEDTSIDESEPPLKAPLHDGLKRGVNLGNALEAPTEGSWGVTLKEDYFQKIKDAGFDFVRIPIRWSAHSSAEAPYTIDEDFFKRIDWAVDQSLTRGLSAVINIHHFDEFMQDPEGNKERLLAIWEQIAKHYSKQPNKLYFEILNEPTNTVSSDNWNSILTEVIKKIRKTNPKRYIVVGGVNWNSITSLQTLELPKDDKYLIATFHYYNPFQFTHQGAEWATGSRAWMGTPWVGTKVDKLMVTGELQSATKWAAEHNVPLLMGEFGAYSKAEMVYRERWTRFMAREAEKRNIAWSYWEFCSGFGVYDSGTSTYRPELLRALVPDSELLK